MYNPKPVNTSGVELSEELDQMIEVIAENVHDVWAEGRIAEGWTYGEKKDGERRTTPLLVPYGDLPENEKEVDRATVRETLRILLSLGYRIIRDDSTKLEEALEEKAAIDPDGDSAAQPQNQ